jgi:hypothetical protein
MLDSIAGELHGPIVRGVHAVISGDLPVRLNLMVEGTRNQIAPYAKR